MHAYDGDRNDSAARASPVVIGGTGGSGTRLVLSIVQAAGRFMGADLNAFGDALDLARFDWRWGLCYVRARRTGQRPTLAEMAADHDDAVRRHLASIRGTPQPWGWKHPHSYLMLPFLLDRHRGLRFVHVVRDGRDMAFSSNQQQARHYGPAAFGPSWTGPEPIRSAAYWAWANGLAAEDGERVLGNRYLRIRFEDLCSHPESTVRRLLGFAGVAEASEEMLERAVNEISPPASTGRWRHADGGLVTAVAEAARPALRRFGYEEPDAVAASVHSPERRRALG